MQLAYNKKTLEMKFKILCVLKVVKRSKNRKLFEKPSSFPLKYILYFILY